MKNKIEWIVVNRESGHTVAVLSTPAHYRARVACLSPLEVIRPVTDIGDVLPPPNATCSVSEWLAVEIRTEQSHHAAAWARGDHVESRRASEAMSRHLEQLLRLASVGEHAAGDEPSIEGTPTEREVALTSALAKCRDAFPPPERGSDLEQEWAQAIGDPESVPGYLEAIAAAQASVDRGQYEAVDEKAAFDDAFSPEYLAHRQNNGIPDVSEFAYSVWVHARRPLLALAEQKPRNEILADAIRSLAAWELHHAAGLTRMPQVPMPASFARLPLALTASDLTGLPVIGSVWNHYNGNRYMVFAILNKDSEHQDKYPTLIAYVGSNGKIWARRADDWHRSMKPVVVPAAA